MLAGIAINAIVAGETFTALLYSVVVAAGWALGALRRRVDTQVFTGIYARLVIRVIINEKRQSSAHSAIVARAALSRQFVDFFEQQLPILFTSVVSIIGSAFMLIFIEPVVGISCFIMLFMLGFLLPSYIRRNDQLYLRLNNQLEKEAARIKIANETNLARHYGLLSRLRISISNREAMGFLVVGLIAAVLFSIAIVLLSASKASAGHIYSVFTYLWTFAISLDDGPRLIEDISNLKDIGKRVSVELQSDLG